MNTLKTILAIALFYVVGGTLIFLFIWPALFGFVTYASVWYAKEYLSERKYIKAVLVAIFYSLVLMLAFDKSEELIYDIAFSIGMSTGWEMNTCYNLAFILCGLILFAAMTLGYIIYSSYQEQKKA